MKTALLSIATANPPFRRTQEFAANFMHRVESLPPKIRSRIDSLYERSSIGYRYSCVEDYTRDASEFDFFPKNWSLDPSPTTQQRNAKYRESVLPLVETVAGDALNRSGLTAGDVTHVIAVSCTGFFAPGLDIEVVRRLGLSPNTQRTMIGFMGCYAAFNALRVAHGFCQSDPHACVLIVCAELCTLHFQVTDSMEDAVINSLFSDGAAAAVVAALSDEDASGRLAYAGGHCVLDDNSNDYMTWDIGDRGFKMGLSARVPGTIAQRVDGFVRDLLARNGYTRDDVDFWAIHPGGRAIIDRVAEVLGLQETDLTDSFDVLREFGNMSSPTILFILSRILAKHTAGRDAGAPGFGTGVAMAFGPGLTLEGCLFARV